jgi:nucleoside-diphosphate-sugar epimerase
MINWAEKNVLITGGASFIGSHLAEKLVARGATVRVVDNLSSGRIENVQHLIDSRSIEFRSADLLDPDVAASAMRGVNYVFHNAADHGGRGYIDLHQVNCSTNLILDGSVFRAAERAGVEKVIFASSGCVYPANLQCNPEEELYLTEDLVGPPFNADNLYGWAKLMGEMTLSAYVREGRMKSVSLRYFTAYGPRCPESHAVMAMIARAVTDQNPFEVWGTGEQVRNWTHVSDIVEGTIRAAERVEDGSAINIGTMVRTKVVECVLAVLSYMGKNPKLSFDPSKPTGPYNRVCDLTLCHQRLDWTPKMTFLDGLHSTIDWYVKHHDASQLRASLDRVLTERHHTLIRA